MCYRPLETGMERITIISNLRLPVIQVEFVRVLFVNRPHINFLPGVIWIRIIDLSSHQFPEPTADFDLLLHKSQARVIRWLLTHDVSIRPSAAELLSSDCLPRPPLEEAQFVDTLKRALSHTASANYHKLMGNLFDRSQTLIQDQCWDLDPMQVGIGRRISKIGTGNTEEGKLDFFLRPLMTLAWKFLADSMQSFNWWRSLISITE